MIEHYPVSNKNYIFALIALIFFWAISLLTNQLAFTYFSAFLGTIISFSYLLKFFNGTLNPFKFLRIASVSLIFTTNLCWILSGIFVFIYYEIDLFLFLENYLNINYESYLEATIFTLIFSVVLFFFSLNEKLILKEKYVFNKLRNAIEIDYKTIHLIIAVIIIIEILLFYYGFIGYRTYAQENFKLGIISPYVPYIRYIFHFHIGLIALLIYKNSLIKFNLRNYFLILVSLLLLNLIFFSRGRFEFFFSYVELTFWYCFFKNGLPKLKTTIISLLIFLPIIYNLLIFNELLRQPSNPVQDLENKNLFTRIENAYEMWKFSSAREITIEKTTLNLTSRFLLAHPLAKSFELKSSQKQFLLGQNILNNLIWTIPRAILPQKINFLVGENLIYEKFGLDFIDTSNSLYLFSYLDFWYFGLFLYPLLFFFYWKLLLFLITIEDLNPLILIFILSRSLILFFALAEGGMLQYLVYARNSAIILVILIILSKLFFSKSKKIF